VAKILVIEDEMEIRSNLLELLSLEGYEIMGADNGVTGVIGAMEFCPDIVLCDVMMPELDGYDVLRSLRQEPKTALIPFIFLTALADKGDLRQGMDLGADDYLTKPFTCAEVLSAIETRLSREALVVEKAALARQQAIAAQQKAQAFKDARDLEKAALISDVRRQMKGTIAQLNTVHSLLQTLSVHPVREQSLDAIQRVCAAELKLLARIPNFEYLLEDNA